MCNNVKMKQNFSKYNFLIKVKSLIYADSKQITPVIFRVRLFFYLGQRQER